MSFLTPLHEFKQGFTKVLYTTLSRAPSICEQRQLKNLFIGVLITSLVIYLVSVPIQLVLFILRLILSVFSAKLALSVSELSANVAFSSLFLELFWYIPLLLLLASRTLGLFDSEPFYERLRELDEPFARALLVAKPKQTLWTSLRALYKRIGQLLMVSMALVLLKLLPFGRVVVSLVLLVYEYYKRIKSVRLHMGNAALIALIALMCVLSTNVTEAVLYVCNAYLTTLALSREFMSPYFQKVTYKEERKDTVHNQWLLLGFGTALTLCFSIPVLGLLFYSVFQRCAAEVVIIMLSNKQLSFTYKQH